MKINQNIIQDVINILGIQHQKIKAIEELAELITAITQEITEPNKKSDEITTEIADVYIMLEQLKIIYDLPDKFIQDEIDFKLTRLRAGLKGGVK